MENKFQLIIIDSETGETLVDESVCAICGGAVSATYDDEITTQEIGLSACSGAHILAAIGTAKSSGEKLLESVVKDFSPKTNALGDNVISILDKLLKQEEDDE